MGHRIQRCRKHHKHRYDCMDQLDADLGVVWESNVDTNQRSHRFSKRSERDYELIELGWLNCCRSHALGRCLFLSKLQRNKQQSNDLLRERDTLSVIAAKGSHPAMCPFLIGEA